MPRQIKNQNITMLFLKKLAKKYNISTKYKSGKKKGKQLNKNQLIARLNKNIIQSKKKINNKRYVQCPSCPHCPRCPNFPSEIKLNLPINELQKLLKLNYSQQKQLPLTLNPKIKQQIAQPPLAPPPISAPPLAPPPISAPPNTQPSSSKKNIQNLSLPEQLKLNKLFNKKIKEQDKEQILETIAKFGYLII